MRDAVPGGPTLPSSARGCPVPGLHPEAAFGLVVIAASAGGVEALRAVLSRLPAGFPAPIGLVLHLSPRLPSRLPELLRRWSRLDAAFAAEGERPRAGTVYAAPPNRHLVVRPDGRFGLLDTAKVNFTRPAADPLFETAAARFGRRALAVVLTGMGRDGASGARAIRAEGGTVIAQDPGTAFAPSMPGRVVASGAAQLVLPPAGVADALTALVMLPGAAGLLGPRYHPTVPPPLDRRAPPTAPRRRRPPPPASAA